ncbi:hypothetical protein CRUP_016218, partial [Coryphaenoides rupestris]
DGYGRSGVCGVRGVLRSAHAAVHPPGEQQAGGRRVITLTSEWSQNNLVGGSRLRYMQQWTLLVDHRNDHNTLQTILPPGPCAPLQGELLCGFSPVRGLRAVIRETAASRQVLEIWDSHGLRKGLDLTALNKHGRVYDDAQFGCLSWSECERRLLYVAERTQSSSPESPGKSPCGKDRSVYREDWGEGFTSKSLPVLCVVELETGDVRVLRGIPPQVSPGQALWAPGSHAVLFVGWSHEPFRLGLKFCSNRRLSPDGATLVYLQGRVFGPHNQCVSLRQPKHTAHSVNYRGSAGFGQDSILSLIGRIGNQDVKDVQRAMVTALQSDATLDPARLAVIGGSHGGFLACHLVGQYPDVYRACAARNPVINAATLLGTSDIVDWRYSSVGLQYSYDQIPTAEALTIMLETSPITHAAQIQAPVLLMLGAKDKRVSPHQGLELYKVLKSRDSPV